VQTIFEDDENNERTIGNISWRIMPSATATVRAGTTWSILDSWTLQNDGILNIYGTVINFDQFTNEGTINNRSGNTLDNRGTLTNEGTIINHTNGKIRNTGIIDNNGTITNNGEFQSVQTAEEMGVIDGSNPVQLIDNAPPSGGGGGCNAGYGLLGLLPLAVCVARRRTTA
jgi:hypothetical protein